MAIGSSAGRTPHVPSTCPVPGCGPVPAADRVGKHVAGSGAMPGTGTESSEPSSQGDANQPRADGLR